jgi:hypothetical protein
LTTWATSGTAVAEPTAATSKVPVGFSKLVARIDKDEIGFAKPEYRVHILEALRQAGFNAVGAESLVFDKDEGARAEMLLGGTVQEVECREVRRTLRCRVGIEWQLLDRGRDEIAYRVLTRFSDLDLPRKNDAALAKRLTLGALGSLMKRERFQKLLNAERSALPADGDNAVATKGCPWGIQICTTG